MAIKKGFIVRIAKEFKNVLDKIIKLEHERGNEHVSYYDASTILAKRIELAGGLKEV